MLPEVIRFIGILPEPCLLVSGEGGILAANPAAGELSGAEPQAMVGTPFHTLVHDEPDRVADYVRLCSRSRELLPGSFQWKTRDGGAADIRVDAGVVTARTDIKPAVVFVRCRSRSESIEQLTFLHQKFAVLSNESAEQKNAEIQRDELVQSERAAREDAERASRMKDEFLATLSHELRTPLNSILGWTQLLLRKEDLSPDTAQGLEVIERNARVQKQLIEDLLDMSRIISGKVPWTFNASSSQR
jgi:PAS domain S-box-containing protein